jgi:aldehyde dehydrogenase (NAD+)
LSNPFDGSPIDAAVQIAGEEDVELAVAAAQAAFKTGPWAKWTGAQRGAVMNKFADLIEKNASQIAELDSICVGIPTGDSAGFYVPTAASVFRCKYSR